MTALGRLLAAALSLLALGLFALGVLAGPAFAVASGEVVEQLQDKPVYLEPGAPVRVDETAVRRRVSGAQVPVYVAVVTQATSDRAGGPAALVERIGVGTRNSSSTVLVITERAPGQPVLRAASGSKARSAGIDGEEAINRVLQGSGGAFDEAAATGAVAQFVDILDQQAAGGTGSSLDRSPSDGGGAGTGVVLGLLALVGAGAGVAVLRRGTKRRAKALESDRADVESLYGRLGSDVATLSAGDDPVTRQALSDASERYGATGALMSQADTPGEFAAARRTAIEGLTAARVARERLGLDPGPDIPPPPSTGPQLEQQTRVEVDDQEYDGSPTYAPGRGHYFGGGVLGGRMVPGGWYGVPFWETMLLGSILSGGLGGGGYERGDEEGVDDAGEARRGGGGDGFGWGGGNVGGGDWGGGGGGGGGSGSGGGGGGDGGGGNW